MIVSNTGPILSFARAHHLDLLRNVVDVLTIPKAVHEEIVVHGAGRPGADEVSGATWIQRESVGQDTLAGLLPSTLHLGEREAIALAHAHGAVLLIDDRAARQAAEAHGVRCMGSLRVLEEAKARALIPAVKPTLDDLVAASLYISDALYEFFLRHMNEAHTA